MNKDKIYGSNDVDYYILYEFSLTRELIWEYPLKKAMVVPNIVEETKSSVKKSMYQK